MKSNSASGLTAKRSNRRFIAVLAAFAVCASAHAWTYDSSKSGSSTTHSAQLRVGADFNKKWQNGVGLHIEEDLRFDLGGQLSSLTGTATTPTVSAVTPCFNKSYTTLSVSYKDPRWPYLKVEAGYTLKIMGTKDWAQVNKWMRHRVHFGVTGSYRYEQWSFSLREQFQTEIRMDSIQSLTQNGVTYYEHNRATWYMRSKLQVAYHVMSKPVKPYVWCELVNTLNATELERVYPNNDPTTGNGQQYIRRVRTSAGVVWRLTRRSSLDFYYRFNYGYERDVNIKPNKGIIILTEEKSFQHAIGIAYNFGW